MEIIIALALIYVIALIMLIMKSDRSRYPTACILLGLFFSPLLGWIFWAITAKETTPTSQSHSKEKLAAYYANLSAQPIIDPVDAWEAQQAAANPDRKPLPPLPSKQNGKD